MTDAIHRLKSLERRSIGKQKRLSAEFKSPAVRKLESLSVWPKSEGKMEEGVTIAKVPDWMTLKPEMMQHLIREHEKLGRTLTEEETVTLLRSLGFEISEPK